MPQSSSSSGRLRRPPFFLAALLAAVVIGVTVDPTWPRHSHAAISEYSMTFTDFPATITVPSNATQVKFVVQGGSGEYGTGVSHLGAWIRGGTGGPGGQISATVVVGPYAVRPGDKLRIIPGRSADYVQDERPLTGGPSGGQGGLNGAQPGGPGGWGGGGSGVYVERTHQWLVVAGGGGGGSGASTFAVGRNGGSASEHGQSSNTSRGGVLGANCPETGADASSLRGSAGGSGSKDKSNGGGGGGGGGCYGGGGGEAGGTLDSGGGGAGGRTWNFADARNVQSGTAPRGGGSVEVILDVYTEPPPKIISPARFDLAVGQPVTANVESEGKPPPHYAVSGTFPAGLRFSYSFSGIGEIRGTPEPGSEGTYPVRVTAENEWGSDTQNLELVVHAPEAKQN